jgi:hypothetical protein
VKFATARQVIEKERVQQHGIRIAPRLNPSIEAYRKGRRDTLVERHSDLFTQPLMAAQDRGVVERQNLVVLFTLQAMLETFGEPALDLRPSLQFR